MPSLLTTRWWALARAAAAWSAAAWLLTGCQTPPAQAPAQVPIQTPAKPPATSTAPPSAVFGPLPAESGSARQSAATTPRAYRESGASHLYGLNKDRIYKGRMPPMLYAVGVLDVEIDRAGHVSRLNWQRAPRHAPEVMREIERMVRAASPFPAPTRMGRVVYKDVWLWHQSGRFQLDTLTEGQD